MKTHTASRAVVLLAATLVFTLGLSAAPRGHRSEAASSAHEPGDAPPIETTELENKISAPELRERLGQFYTYFVNALEGTVARAESGEPDVEKRERLTLIKIRAARACRNAAFQSSPVAGYIDTLALCVQMRTLVNTPETVELLGADRAEFVTLTEKLDREITTLGARFLDPAAIEKLHANLEAFAQGHPIGTSRAIVPPSGNFDANLPGLGWLIDLPLAPFHALQGVDQTAQAVSDFNGVAGGFSRTLAYLPLELAWESRLLVLQLRRESEAAARALIDHAALRAAQLLAATFALAFLWRLLPPRRAKAAP